MSSDMMLVCEEDKSYVSGVEDWSKANTKLAFFIDECSMGDPWNEFGKWFQERYCKAPGILDQMAGMKDHSFMKLSEEDIAAIEMALKSKKAHKGMNKTKLMEWLKSHVGKHISTENW